LVNEVGAAEFSQQADLPALLQKIAQGDLALMR
jgi:hypothetical protein